MKYLSAGVSNNPRSYIMAIGIKSVLFQGAQRRFRGQVLTQSMPRLTYCTEDIYDSDCINYKIIPHYVNYYMKEYKSIDVRSDLQDGRGHRVLAYPEEVHQFLQKVAHDNWLGLLLPSEEHNDKRLRNEGNRMQAIFCYQDLAPVSIVVYEKLADGIVYLYENFFYRNGFIG